MQNKNFFSEYPPAKPYFLADHTWRTLGSSTFGTICFPKAVRPAERAGATFYKITAKIMNGDEFKGVVLTEVEGELEAGIPYIFKKEGDATYIVAAMHGDAVTVAGSQGGLVGTLSEEEGGFAVPAGMYILQGDKLWQTTLNDKGESQSRLLAGRAYIDPSAITATVSYENANGVKGFILGVDAPFDGITQPQTEQRRDIHTTYDLQGRPVRQLLRGQTYIINGRKVHIK